MADKVGSYLESIRTLLKIDSAVNGNVTQEIRTHLEDKSHELRELGLDEEEAVRVATESFGPPQLVAQQLYQVHGQGTWQEAFFAALPHVLVALVFVSYYWQNIVCLSSTLATIACVAVYGWCHNKPMWLFPWLGYYLLPVILTGILLICLPQGWTWLGALAYIPLALFVIASIVKQTANRDWLYVSLMLAPLPVVFSWLLALGSQNGLLACNIQLAQLRVDIPWIVISFLILAIATVVSIRVRQRWCKAIALLIPSIGILASVALASGGNVGFWAWLILTLSLLALVSPIWLELRS
jgi:hypothetical protein